MLSAGSLVSLPVTLAHKTGPFESGKFRHDVVIETRGRAVKKSGFTEEQITYALKQAELGTRVAEVCRKMGLSDATFYIYGLLPTQLRYRQPSLRPLERFKNLAIRESRFLHLRNSLLTRKFYVYRRWFLGGITPA